MYLSSVSDALWSGMFIINKKDCKLSGTSKRQPKLKLKVAQDVLSYFAKCLLQCLECINYRPPAMKITFNISIQNNLRIRYSEKVKHQNFQAAKWGCTSRILKTLRYGILLACFLKNSTIQINIGIWVVYCSKCRDPSTIQVHPSTPVSQISLLIIVNCYNQITIFHCRHEFWYHIKVKN